MCRYINGIRVEPLPPVPQVPIGGTGYCHNCKQIKTIITKLSTADQPSFQMCFECRRKWRSGDLQESIRNSMAFEAALELPIIRQ